MINLKEGFIPPLEIEYDNFFLEVLAPKHNEIDYEAWSSSRENLKGVFGPHNPWPEDVSSLEKNYEDLENHFKEFEQREAFAYTILNPNHKLCIGCLYIRPDKTSRYDCRVDFWFRDSHIKLEEMFYPWVQQWLSAEWGFGKVVYPGRSISWNEYYD